MSEEAAANDPDPKFIHINLYDSYESNTIQEVDDNTTAVSICEALSSKLHLSGEDSKFYTLVLVVTLLDVAKKCNTNYLRTLHFSENILRIKGALVSKLIKRHKYSSENESEVGESVRWFFKDIRTGPIDLKNDAEVVGEYPSDDESEYKEMSQSDLAYLAKAERKGFLLKKSSTDPNLWRRWYCVLTDHLWCIKPNEAASKKALLVELNSITRYRERNPFQQQLKMIPIISSRKTHYFRAFNVLEQCKWMEDLNTRTSHANDNSFFNIAEVMMCDQQQTGMRRSWQHIEPILDAAGSGSNIFDAPSLLAPYRVNHRISSVTFRSDRQFVLHKFHASNRALADIMAFFIQVQKFREMHSKLNLLNGSEQQRTLGLRIYAVYIVPQLKLGQSSSIPPTPSTMASNSVEEGDTGKQTASSSSSDSDSSSSVKSSGSGSGGDRLSPLSPISPRNWTRCSSSQDLDLAVTSNGSSSNNTKSNIYSSNNNSSSSSSCSSGEIEGGGQNTVSWGISWDTLCRVRSAVKPEPTSSSSTSLPLPSAGSSSTSRKAATSSFWPWSSSSSNSNAAAAAAAVTDASNLNPPPVVLVATLFDEVVMQLRSTILPAPASS